MLKFHWFLPTNGGDGRQVVGGGHGVEAGASGRPASVPYLGQIARSAEQLGFEAALTPTGAWCEDAWVSTAMLSSLSERLKFLVAFRPGLTAPFLAAQMAGTFQNLSGGRLLLNVVTGGESHEQRMFGDFLDKDDRYARCDEFLEIVRRLWDGETVTFEGEHLRVEDATLAQIPDPQPLIYFGGSSPAAGRVAARHADVYLTWGEPPEAVAEKVDGIRKLAADAGRELRFGIRLHTIARDTADAAWAEADRLLAGIDPADIERVQAGLQAQRVRGPAADARAQPGQQGRPRDPPEPVGRRRAGPRRSGHRDGRQPHGGRRPRSSSTPPSASTSSSCPATRTSRRRTGSARASCRCWPSAASGSTPRRTRTPRPPPYLSEPREQRHDRPPHARRRRRRQPQAGQPHARGRPVPRPPARG